MDTGYLILTCNPLHATRNFKHETLNFKLKHGTT